MSSGRMISYVSFSLSTPSWWMPASWAKAFSPTMALLGWTCTPVMWDSSREVRKISSVLHPRLHAEEVLAGAERHHDLFERGVARALADAVDRALDLPRARS